MINVSVTGLRAVVANTTLVTKPGAVSYCSARIVVTTAAGIDA